MQLILNYLIVHKSKVQYYLKEYKKSCNKQHKIIMAKKNYQACKNADSMIHNQKKIIQYKHTEMMELAGKDVKTATINMLHMFKKT